MYYFKNKAFVIILYIFICLSSAFINSKLSYGVEPVEYSQGFQASSIIIGFDPSLPPYQFDDNGDYKGFFIDLISNISNDLNLDIKLIPLPLNECYDKLSLREIDGILGIRYSENDESSYGLQYSEALINSTISIAMSTIKSESIKASLGNNPVLIAVERNTAEHEFVKSIRRANYNLSFNQENIVELLYMKRADMVIGVRHSIEHILDYRKLSEYYTISNSFETPVSYYLALSSDKSNIINQINEQIKSYKVNGTYENIYNLWINDKMLEKQKKIEKNLYIMLLIVMSAVAMAILISAINLQLKKKVETKTQELSDANKTLEKSLSEIRNTNALKDLMFQSSPRSIIIFDNDACISAMNEQALKLCNLAEAPLKTRVDSIAPLDEMVSDYIPEVLNSGKQFLSIEYEYNISLAKRYYRYFIYPLFNDEKQLLGGIITIEDSTEERLFRDQFTERLKNKALIKLISGIAHEIRNPLTSIKTYAELIPRKKDNELFQKQISTVIPAEVERVDKLIENLIDYIRPKQKNITSFNLFSLIESCMMLFLPSFQKNNIKFTTNADSKIFIIADENQIKQVLINIVLNSIDAIDEEKNHSLNLDFDHIINISASIDTDNLFVCIKITDTGIGMSEDEIENAFELFYSTKQRGSGIGLPLSKQIIEENEGKILIQSQKHIGTEIDIFLKGEII